MVLDELVLDCGQGPSAHGGSPLCFSSLATWEHTEFLQMLHLMLTLKVSYL